MARAAGCKWAEITLGSILSDKGYAVTPMCCVSVGSHSRINSNIILH